jgi:predicted metal-dependent peptidase
MSKYAPGEAIKRCKNQVMVLGFTHPHFLLIHSKISELYVETKGTPDDPVQTMGITATGKILLNPEFTMGMEKEEVTGVLAHEMLHLVLQHHERRGGRDPWLWNVATDMCINSALRTDGLKLPKSALYPPPEYSGDLFAETLFDWLTKNPDKVPARPKGQPAPGAGCSPIDDPNGKSPDWRQVGLEARALAQQAGKGTSGVATLLAPRTAKIPWNKVIRTGFQMAAARPGRDYQTFQKRHRRSPVDGPQFPGWMGMGPRIAVCIDVSGSMDRKWVELIVSECKNLLKQFPDSKCYLNAHTSDVVYSTWLNRTTKGKIDEAVQFSGGTDPNPAYIDIKNQGKFDTLIHFTDCCFFDVWPEVPAKHLVVGAFTREPATKPPAGSTIIPCDIG